MVHSRTRANRGARLRKLFREIGIFTVPQTMYWIRSTCSGFEPGMQSNDWAISPSRITRMRWLRPIISSRVSAVRRTATPSAVTSRISW
ncbi:hypothetical protein D9M71_588110 [compost metagenome]